MADIPRLPVAQLTSLGPWQMPTIISAQGMALDADTRLIHIRLHLETGHELVFPLTPAMADKLEQILQIARVEKEKRAQAKKKKAN
jgi:hypothetical protein